MGDSYRPTRGSNRPRNRPPPSSLADRITFGAGGGGDSYRPGGSQQNQHEFTFTSGRPGPQFPPQGPKGQDANAPRARRKKNQGGRNDRRGPHRAVDSYTSQANDNRQDQNGYGRRPWRPFRKEAPHERALLQVPDKDAPEQTLGVAEGETKFLNPDDLSESEGEMELEGDPQLHGATDDKSNGHKMARVQSISRADGNSVPKWSNPDPYTVLPPPDETTGKRLNVLEMIRRAKKQAAEQNGGRNAVAENDDYIRLGDDPSPPPSPAPSIPPPPSGPRPSGLSSVPPPPPPPLSVPAYEGSLNQIVATGVLTNAVRSAKRTAEVAGLPDRPQHPGRQGRKRKLIVSESGVIEEWMAGSYVSPCPWHKANPKDAARLGRENPGADCDKMQKMLHNEIMEFYEFVRPRDHIHRVRQNLIVSIEKAIKDRGIMPDAGRVLCFGSFPEQLYLPTADMDLVFVTNHHHNGGERLLDYQNRRQVNSTLRSTARRLEGVGIATQVVVITKARVPIIKFKDRKTGVHVDISFENLSGVVAQQTFRDWKDTWKDEFTHLVALVKQFLVMRGLSDVHTGGLGGFSIICLVVFFLELWHAGHPDHGNVDYGRLFMDFLEFYGKEFDIATQRIVMNPARLVAKDHIGIDGRQEKADRLSIQDPNDSNNNISGGSSRAKEVFRLFAIAHDALLDRTEKWDPSGNSILDSVLGGNYQSYVTFMAQINRMSLDDVLVSHSRLL